MFFLKRKHPVRRAVFGLFLGWILFGSFLSSASAAVSCCKCHLASDPNTNICLTDENLLCDNIVEGSQNADLNGVVCEQDPLTGNQCNPVSSGGGALCVKGPIQAKNYTKATAPAEGEETVLEDAAIPRMNVPIPGLRFSDVTVKKSGKELVLSIPFFVDYVAAIYQYMLGIVVLAASCMLIYGGLHYIVGTTLSSVERGKEIIRDSIIGLLLAFSAYTVLTLLNPATTTYNALQLTYVQQEHLNLEPISSHDSLGIITANNPGTNSGGGGGSLASGGGGITGEPGSKVKDGTCELTINYAGIPTVMSLYECGVQIAKEHNVPPCYITTAINYESYLALSLPGHDENVASKICTDKNNPTNCRYTKARTDFLASGVTFKGKPISGDMMNDDEVDYTREDLGFDPRFSHGGGLMGLTVPCVNLAAGGQKCYTMRQRLDPYYGMEGVVLGLETIIKQQRGKDPVDPATISAVWTAYHGADTVNRIKDTKTCLTSPNPYGQIPPQQFNICRGDLPFDMSACKAEVARVKALGFPIPESACQPLLGCGDPRMPIKRENGEYKVRNP